MAGTSPNVSKYSADVREGDEAGEDPGGPSEGDPFEREKSFWTEQRRRNEARWGGGRCRATDCQSWEQLLQAGGGRAKEKTEDTGEEMVTHMHWSDRIFYSFLISLILTFQENDISEEKEAENGGEPGEREDDTAEAEN